MDCSEISHAALYFQLAVSGKLLKFIDLGDRIDWLAASCKMTNNNLQYVDEQADHARVEVAVHMSPTRFFGENGPGTPRLSPFMIVSIMV